MIDDLEALGDEAHERSHARLEAREPYRPAPHTDDPMENARDIEWDAGWEASERDYIYRMERGA